MTNQAKPGSLRARFEISVKDTCRLNDELEAAIPEPVRHPNSSIKHGKVSAAPIPWFSQAAFLVLDLHAEAREREATMRLAAGLPSRPRGNSAKNTVAALEAAISVSWNVDDGRVDDYRRWLDSWCRRAMVALGETDAPQQLPQEVGGKQPKCPFCSKQTLRMWPIRGEIRCLNPACRDEEGRKPRAQMEFSNFTREWELVWSDGGVGVPV